MARVAAGELRDFASELLIAIGLDPLEAEAVAACLVEANLRGVDSHGVLRLIQYHRSVSAGEVNPRPVVELVHRRGPVALLDAGGGYGFVPAQRAMQASSWFEMPSIGQSVAMSPVQTK